MQFHHLGSSGGHGGRVVPPPNIGVIGLSLLSNSNEADDKVTVSVFDVALGISSVVDKFLFVGLFVY
jgi:hypothetical protein